MFDFFTENLYVILILASVIASFFGKKEGAGKPSKTPRGKPQDPELVRRTKEIQEEIRRKILDRQSQAPKEVTVEEPLPQSPLTEEVPPVFPEPMLRPSVAPPQKKSEPFPLSTAEKLDQQREQIRKMQEQVATLQKKPVPSAKKQSTPVKAVKKNPISTLQEDIISLPQRPKALRKAVLYREIIGPPVALQPRNEALY